MTGMLEREAAKLRVLREEMRQQDKEREQRKRWLDRDKELERIWVVFAWQNTATRRVGKRVIDVKLDGYQWVLAGFRRRRKRRKPQTMNKFFAKVRRKLGIARDTELKLVDLWTAQKAIRRGRVWREMLFFTPPHRQVPGKPLEPIEQPDLVLYKKEKPRRIKKDTSIRFHKKRTTYITLARNPWDRVEGHLYIGPMAATTQEDAEREGRALMPHYKDIIAVPVASLSKRLRNAMHTGRKVRPGQRILWPEPIGIEDVTTWSFTRLHEHPDRRRDAALLIRHAEKQAWGALRKGREADAVHWMAVLTFLHEWGS